MGDDMADLDSDTTSDVVRVIHQQHETIRELFGQVAGSAPAERGEPFEAIVRLLAVHETAEEMVVYPDLRATGDRAATIVESRTNEEDAAKKALADLEGMDVASAEFERAFAQFRDEVETHADREEREVIPLLEEFDDGRRRRMGRRFQLAEAMAPTHAHRLAPESALGNVLVGPFVAMVDRVRDAIRDAERDDS